MTQVRIKVLHIPPFRDREHVRALLNGCPVLQGAIVANHTIGGAVRGCSRTSAREPRKELRCAPCRCTPQFRKTESRRISVAPCRRSIPYHFGPRSRSKFRAWLLTGPVFSPANQRRHHADRRNRSASEEGRAKRQVS